MPLSPDVVGHAAGPITTVVDRDHVKAYAAATNEESAECAAGEAVPPVFAVTPSWDIVMGVVQDVLTVDQQLSIVHGWQDMHFARALQVGESLTSRAEIFSVRGSRVGTELVVRASTTASDGSPVVDIYTTCLVRGVTDDAAVGPDRPVHALDRAERGPKLADVVRHVDADQTFRYRDASGDTMPIHVDAELARRMGFPGIIAHGLCTMAMCGQAVLRAAGDVHPSRVRRLAVRFTRPVFPDSDVIVSVFDAGADPAGLGTRYAFEAKSRVKVVVKDGLAVIA